MLLAEQVAIEEACVLSAPVPPPRAQNFGKKQSRQSTLRAQHNALLAASAEGGGLFSLISPRQSPAPHRTKALQDQHA